MAEKRRALGRGLGALIPSAPATPGDRPVDVFFRDRSAAPSAPRESTAPEVSSTPDQVGTPGALPAVDDLAATRSAVTQSTDDSRTHLTDASNGAAGPATSDAADGQRDDTAASEQSAPVVDESASSGLAPVPGATFAEVDISAIRPNPRQPRTVFDEDQLAELVHSIAEIGVLQPVVVRPATPSTADTDGDDGVRYELIMGERRWRASQEAGLATIPAIIKETHDDDLLRDALLENLHRSQLNPLEEAAAYQQLLDDFGCSHDELAGRLGRSRPQISNTLRLLRLPPLVQRRVAAGVLSAGHARALLGLADAAAMERLAQRIVAEGLSVRTVEEIVTLGDDETPARQRRPRSGARHPQLDDLSAHLADHLETRVAIALGRRKGKITVEFASVEDLERILALMGIDEREREGASDGATIDGHALTRP
ncbi:ParB/RepB/Spo0J family partition protein [Terracoccus luteus]|uniref:ParB/RepB/Spo0J family partition protein n=1 Tax=Terracoccus luteus TaxID=53356 RepID=UPI0016103A89|nr:ParB/RepB/Spo0J family partition protein [Terracoccus luteus]MCP2172909.1 ParB family chromosome partitioning protein [Terracoccus luteus]